MPDGGDSFEIAAIDRLADIPADAWDACAGAANPFVSHAFLSALEDSGSVRPETGWLPQHLTLKDGAGRLLGTVPLYLKGHSHGEYIFDHAWAGAYERAGGRYYPKLLSAVPFTPVAGPRLMTAPHAPAGTRAALIQGLKAVCERHGTATLGLNFTDETDTPALEEAGFLIRHGHQFHWTNDGYGTFEDFLDALQSRKRKQIRKERRAVARAGLTVERLTGADLKPRHWDQFHAFYIDTYDRKWGSPYLTRAFFDLMQDRLADRVLLVLARADGRPIAGALNLIGTQALFGRNWGCLADYRFLHFELCYYQAIEFAIERGLARVEAGTQGEHKLQRGYLPMRTRSAHWIRDPGFREAIDRFLGEERRHVAHAIAALGAHGPFRREDT